MAKGIKQSITTTVEFHAAVENYRQQHGLKNWATALIELAARSLSWEREAAPIHGGIRKGAGRKPGQSKTVSD